MGKKLKKDFKERHKASIEREILHSETGITPEESKHPRETQNIELQIRGA